MRAVVKVSWSRNGSGEWYAELLLAEEGGFDRMRLAPGAELGFEVTDERRCTGYAPEPGERAPCPDFMRLDSGSQCGACRGRDIYSDYVRGDRRTDLEGEFSVYLAQIGEKLKVGVTRSSHVEGRWIEQGADFAAEVETGISSSEALERENEIYREGVAQRIRKEDKIERSDCRLEERMEKLGLEGEVRDLGQLTIYPEPSCSKLQRSGRVPGELQSVKGQIISDGRVCMAMGSGRVLDSPKQTGLRNF